MSDSVEAETPILRPPDENNWLIWKDDDAEKDWRQEEKGTTEDEMVEWHHQFNGHEFEQTPGVGNGQGGLVFCSPWCCKESNTSEQLHWIELNYKVHGNLQARILGWVAFPFSRGFPQPRDQTQVPHIAIGLLTNWVMREATTYINHSNK